MSHRGSPVQRLTHEGRLLRPFLNVDSKNHLGELAMEIAPDVISPCGSKRALIHKLIEYVLHQECDVYRRML